MINNLKKSSKTLYGVSLSIVVFMAICYFGINTTKKTYSATDCKYDIDKHGYYDSSGKPCTLTSSYACYVVNHKYVWSASNPGGSKVDISQAKCSGCANGYKDDGKGNCVSITELVCTGTGEYDSPTKCQAETGTECISYGGCWKKGGSNLGSGVSCISGNTSSTCGSGRLDVCGVLLTYTCEYGGKEYKYSCTHDSGSQTGGNGAYSTCTSPQLTGVCFLLNHKYTWGSPTMMGVITGAGGTAVNRSHANCTGCESGYTESNGNCVSSTGDNTGGNTGGGGGNTGGGNTNPSNPSTSSNPSSTPSSSIPKPSSSTPSSSSNITENPKTGTVAILIVWIIALGTLAYSFVYFRQLNKNKK